MATARKTTTARRKPTAKQAVEADPRMVTYLCETGNDGYRRGGPSSFQFQVPEHWEVTFSYVSPDHANGAHCVRVYEPMPDRMAKKLRAVYANITSLRDLDIPYAIKVEETASKSEYEQDSRGNFDLRKSRKVLEGGWQKEDDQAF